MLNDRAKVTNKSYKSIPYVCRHAYPRHLGVLQKHQINNDSRSFDKTGIVEKHLGWAIKTIYKKQSRGMLKMHIDLSLDPRLNSFGVLDETTEAGRIVLGKNEFFRASL